MNKHILKVMRYIDNPELSSVEEMMENDDEANAVYAANANAANANAAHASAYAANANAANANAAKAEHWVNEYFKRSSENKQDYTNEVERLK
jgi:hypothetical protein